MVKKRKYFERGLKVILSAGIVSLSAMSGITPLAAGNELKTTPKKTLETKRKKPSKVETTVPYRNVAYVPDWGIWEGQGNYKPKDLPANLFTHANFAFIDFDKNGDLTLTDPDAAFGADLGGTGWNRPLSGMIPALVALREQNPNMKIGISLGGWSKSGDFSAVAANPATRANFVRNLIKFINYTGMDFIDVDWEYPTSVRQPDRVDNSRDEGTPDAQPADKQNYITLMQDIRNALDELGAKKGKKYELSTALPGTKDQLEKFVDVEKLFKIIDFGNMMTYDMNGAWGEKSGHQTALYTNPKDPTGYSIESLVNYLKDKNVEMNKVVIGAAFYSRGWNTVEKGSDPEHPGLFQDAAVTAQDADQTPSRGAQNEAPLKAGDGGRRGGVWSYRSLDKLKQAEPGLKEYWDDVAKAPYLYSEETKAFYTYDNLRSIKAKTDFVKKNHLGGMISWMSSQDKDSDGDSSREELSKGIKEGLYNDEPIPNATEKVNVELNLDVQIKTGNLETGKKGFLFTITNNEPKNEDDEKNLALNLANTYYSAVKNAKFKITTKDGRTFTKGDWFAGNVTSSGNQTTVDLSPLYDGRYITTDKPYTFGLAPSDGMEMSPDNVKKIELEQYYDANTKLFSQVIYGDDSVENQKPTFSGVQDKAIYVGDAFDPMAGVTAVDKEDGDLTDEIKVEGAVDTNVPGTYILTYKVSDSNGLETSAKRTITVKEVTAPVISGVEDKTINVGDNFDKLAGVTAKDGKGADITSKITVEGDVDTSQAGVYTLEYSVTDDYNQNTTEQRTITVNSIKAPTITGVEDKTIDVGDNFDKLAGVTAKDGKGADITSKITVEGDVDTSQAGVYPLEYNVTDDYGQSTSVKRTITVEKETADFGVGHGIEWPKQVIAPFLDDAAWMNDPDYSNNGAPNLKKLSDESGMKFFNLGFIQGTGNVTNGKLNWGWAGLSALSENQDNAQYEGIKQGIRELRESGGDATISFGGLNAGAFWTQTQDVNTLYNTYKEIVDGYGLTRIDLDVEGGAMDYNQNKANAQAIKKLQEATNVKVTLTLPVMPSGLISTGQNVLKAYLETGVDLTNVNIMAMCYGSSVSDYAQGSIEAIDNTKTQIISAYKAYQNQDLTEKEAYAKVGVTPSIGFESNAFPYFTTEMMDKVVKHAKEKGIGMVSFWSMNRDAKIDGGQGQVENRYEFTNTTKQFTSDGNGDNEKPQPPQNLKAINITKNTADLTWEASISSVGIKKYVIEVTENEQVNNYETTDVNYQLTGLKENTSYSVKVKAVDKQDQESTPTTVTFKTKSSDNDGDDDTIPEWDPTKIYNTGDIVKHNGRKYMARYWTQNNEPGLTEPWDEIIPPGDIEWREKKIYLENDVVLYEGIKYRAQWWTKGEKPGEASVWERLNR